MISETYEAIQYLLPLQEENTYPIKGHFLTETYLSQLQQTVVHCKYLTGITEKVQSKVKQKLHITDFFSVVHLAL